MNISKIEIWLKTGLIRKKGLDVPKILSLIESAETNLKIIKTIALNNETASLIFREIYESIRQIGNAKWLLLGYEPANHELCLESLKEIDIKDKNLLFNLDRYRKIRHDINYRGFRATINQAEEILTFWEKCCIEIIVLIKKELEKIKS